MCCAGFFLSVSLVFVFLSVSFPCRVKKDGPGTDFSLTTLQRVRREMAHTFLFCLLLAFTLRVSDAVISLFGKVCGASLRSSTDTLFLRVRLLHLNNEGQTLPKIVPFVIVYRISKNKKNANFFTPLNCPFGESAWIRFCYPHRT